MSEFNWNAIARAAYEAYARMADSSKEQLPLPEYEALPPRMQAAWREAVKTAVAKAAGGNQE